MAWLFCLLFAHTALPQISGIDIEELRHFEFVQPLHLDKHGRQRRDLSTLTDQGNHLDGTIYEFVGFGRNFKLNLVKNSGLISKHFVSVHQNEDGSDNIVRGAAPDNCYYYGSLNNDSHSQVSVSTCDGLRGSIKDAHGEEFYVEPVENTLAYQSNSPRHVLYNMKDVKSKPGFCGNNDSTEENHDVDHHTFTDHLSRKKRDVSEKKYIELALVVDNRKFIEFRGQRDSIAKAQRQALDIANHVDNVYKTLNTRVAVVSVVVWNQIDAIHINQIAGTTLRNFKDYYRNVLKKKLKVGCDNGQLITGMDFKGTVVGLAPIGTMCGYSSCAINQYRSNPGKTANTVAHEMGHNTGMIHNSKGCTCKAKPCVMNEYSPADVVQSFTSCSSEKFNKNAEEGDMPCIFDYPDKLFEKPRCQNGFIEEGESCDCGTPQECQANGGSVCCDAQTCELHKHAECATGSCCDIKQCKFKNEGTLCRDKFNLECDLQEYCAGNSSECTNNFYVPDGTPCESGESYCYDGSCRSLNAQCKNFWGPNAKTAPDYCFNKNREKNSQWSNCGKDDRGQYKPCAKKDVKCGKIQCSAISKKHPLPSLPIVGTNRGTNIAGICRRGYTSMGPDLDDPSLAMEGTKCNDNSICLEKVCTNLTVLAIKQCTTKCLNGGVCNNNGNCHCPPGFACPNCEFAGPGGSLDSGQGCINQDSCGCLTPLVKGMLVLFLLVIPLIILTGYLCYRYRDKIRAKWQRRKQTSDRNSATTSQLKSKTTTKAAVIPHQPTHYPAPQQDKVKSFEVRVHQPNKPPATTSRPPVNKPPVTPRGPPPPAPGRLPQSTVSPHSTRNWPPS